MTSAARFRTIASRYKLRAVAALAALYVAVWNGWSWPWGVWFLAMTIPMVRLGETQLVDVVRRDENPLVFWLIIGTWALLSAALIGWDLRRWAG